MAAPHAGLLDDRDCWVVVAETEGKRLLGADTPEEWAAIAESWPPPAPLPRGLRTLPSC